MNFSAWIMSVVVAVCLTVLIDIFLSEGETKKYVKSAASLVVFAVLISPVPSLFNKEVNFFEKPETSVESAVDSAYLIRYYSKKYSALEDSCEKLLAEKGYDGVAVVINYNWKGSETEIVSVVADASGITRKNANIDIKETIKSALSDALGVDKRCVTVLG